MHWIVLYLLFQILNVATANLYNVSKTNTSISIECNRFYEAKKGTCEEAAYSWDGLDDQYPFADVHKAYNTFGYTGLREECERACAQGNFCRAYSVSSAVSILQGNIHCDIYTSCPNQINGDTNLFIRQAPFNCFIKATTPFGVLKNYNDLVNPWSQITRLLKVELEPFMEIHFAVNGVVDDNTYAIRPYKTLPDFCDYEDSLDCLFLYSGFLGIGLLVVFVGIIATNLIILFNKNQLI